MTPTTTYEHIKTIVMQQLLVDGSRVRPEAALVEDLGADSLDLVESVMRLEGEFRVEIVDQDMERIRTVQDAVEYVDAHAGPPPASTEASEGQP